jgi:hypothetical protein
MKAQFKVSPTLIIEVEGSNQVELFGRLAEAAEVFGEQECGMCQSKDITFIRRSNNGNDFYEMACQNPGCGARLSMGQSRQLKGQLFPIRKIVKSGPDKGRPSRKDGDYDNENRGWTKYRGKPIAEDD